MRLCNLKLVQTKTSINIFFPPNQKLGKIRLEIALLFLSRLFAKRKLYFRLFH